MKTLATPADRYFGLAHADDPFTPVIFANWIALGMDDFGKPRKPEAGAPPYHGTHSLVTKLVPVDDDAHNSTAVDFKTPLGEDGTPLLRAAWDYMLGAWCASPRD